MPLDQAQTQKLGAWLTKQKVNHTCELCGTTDNWSSGEIIAGIVMTSGTVQMGGPVSPMVQLVCGHCGNVRLFATAPMGL